MLTKFWRRARGAQLAAVAVVAIVGGSLATGASLATTQRSGTTMRDLRSLHPAPLAAQAAAGPNCSYAFFDPSSDAPDLNGSQDDQLDLVQGTLGLTSDRSTLRVVMNLKSLSKTIPTGSTYIDYEFFWKNPSGNTGPNAADAQVNSSGTVTYSYGSESATNGVYQFTSAGSATGAFGAGPNGAVEIDIPLSKLGIKTGDVLSAPSAYTADGNPVLGNIVDSDGPGSDYTVGQRTCIDSGGGTTSSTTTTTASTSSSTTTSSPVIRRARKPKHHARHHTKGHHKRRHARHRSKRHHQPRR